MILRLQSRDGIKRITVGQNDSATYIHNQVKSSLQLADAPYSIYTDRSQKNVLKPSTKSISSIGLKHGDILFVDFETSSNERNGDPGTSFQATLRDGIVEGSMRSGDSVSTSMSTTDPLRRRITSESIVEDDVDLQLARMDGKIDRDRDQRMCSHGAHQKCVHCFSLDPWDEGYLHEKEIKHMSFHSYLRSLTGMKGRSSSVALLQNVSCAVKPGCTNGHKPYPEAVCSKCRPDNMILNRQKYRHVDYVAFENASIVDRFIDFWRRSGLQRAGILIGRYEVNSDVPLGIKATVAAVYEPPQTGTRDSIELLDDPDEHSMLQLCAALGLRIVGWIFTDLVHDTGSLVRYTRTPETYLLSAEECITAAWLQNRYPNPCRSSMDGYFGSKFVTVVITGDKDGQIHSEGYQVSNLCMALVRDQCLIPTKDAPELAWVKESIPKIQYVPDVFYKIKDQYGNEVQQLARPLPVEYLMVQVPVGVPVQQQYTFSAVSESQKTPFAIENRTSLGDTQNFDVCSTYVKQFGSDNFFSMIRDFHLLLFLCRQDNYSISMDQFADLFSAIKQQDNAIAFDWSQKPEWAGLQQLMEAHVPEGSGSGAGSSDGPTWSCAHCTFENGGTRNDCEICGLPRN